MNTFGSLQRMLEEDREFVHLFLQILKKHLKRKSLSDLRFAKQTTYGWSFFAKKAADWDSLEKITKEVARQHPHCPLHIIAEKISYLINLSDFQMQQLLQAQ